MKRILSLVLVVMMLSLSVLGTSAAEADITETGKTFVTMGDWVYVAINGGKYWEIDEYIGDDSSVIVPRIVNDMMVTALGNHSFLDNKTVVSVETSSPLWTVGEYTFMNCSSLETFVCNFSLKEIGIGAFIGTTSLKNINLEDSVVTVIKPHVFSNSGIKEVELPETCTEIMHDAFAQCPNLEKIVIPRSVTTIGEDAFRLSDNLTIYCYTDSAAHQYAVANQIPFVLIDGPREVTFILGDADGDDIVTILDATKIQRVLVSLDPDPDGMIALRGHSYDDGEKNLVILDATSIQRWLVEFEVEAPIGEEVTRTWEPKEA